ncbi:MAG: hypothetical protein KGL19_12550 [Bacteroidota bacterium]|nr:hypothetical protein [Bacteroidota bacterium]
MKEIEQEQCNGTIIEIINTQSCFWEVKIKQRENIIRLKLNKCCPDQEFFKFAAIGDSIKKEKGHLTLIISKPNNNVTKQIEYPYCLE